MEKMETRNGTDRIMGNEGDDFFFKISIVFLGSVRGVGLPTCPSQVVADAA
jgi:hypothetical protein